MQYDKKKNEYTGFCFPIGKDGIPHSTFQANNVQDISNYYDRFDKSSFLYVVMAVSLDPNKKSPSFCLAAWGTNQKFTSTQVDKRLKTTVNELEKFGIEVLGWSGDGDTRILKVQRQYTGFSEVSYMSEYFFGKPGNGPMFCVQDPQHVLGKLGNRGLKPSFPLTIGNTMIPLKRDLELLIENVPRGMHGLCSSDLDTQDKMNKTKKMKMCHTRVDVALKEMSMDTQATRLFLRVMRCTFEPFDRRDLTVKERIGLSWYATFILRGWKAYNNAQEFVTNNAYICQEINCHNLLMLVKYLRNTSNASSFDPSKMNSQTCESFFRRLRSFTTSEITQTNFDVKEALSRIQKIMLLEESEQHLSKIGFVLPNEQQHVSPSPMHQELPSDREMEEVIQNVKRRAIRHLEFFGVVVEDENLPCLVKSYDGVVADDEEDEEEDDDSAHQVAGETPDSTQNVITEDVHTQYKGIVRQCEAGPSRFQLTDSQGQTVCLNKSTHLWSLGDNVPVPSVDRRYRFFTKKSVSLPSKEDHVHLNDWVHFENIPFVCRVVDFRKTTNLSQKKVKEVTIGKQFVKISENKEFGLYCNVYELLDDGSLRQVNHINPLISLKRFKNHLPHPAYPGPVYNESTCIFVKEQIHNHTDDNETIESMETSETSESSESEENAIESEQEQVQTRARNRVQTNAFESWEQTMQENKRGHTIELSRESVFAYKQRFIEELKRIRDSLSTQDFGTKNNRKKHPYCLVIFELGDEDTLDHIYQCIYDSIEFEGTPFNTITDWIMPELFTLIYKDIFKLNNEQCYKQFCKFENIARFDFDMLV